MAAVPGQLCFGGRNTPIFLRGASSSCLNNNYELQKFPSGLLQNGQGGWRIGGF